MVATNTFNNVAWITPLAMDVLRNQSVLLPRVNRSFEGEFNGPLKIGDTMSVRIPGLSPQVTAGRVAVPNGYYDTYKQIVLQQYNTSLQFSTEQMALNVQDPEEFKRTVLGPQLVAVTNKIETDGFALYNQIPGFAGTPGTSPTDLQYFLEGKAQLAVNATPMDDQIYSYLEPYTEASMVNGLKGLFQDSSEVAKQYKKGVMGTSAGQNFMTAQNAPIHTVGTYGGTPLVNGTITEAAVTIPSDGWSSGASSLKKGDIVTFAGCYAVNPVSKISTGRLKQFVITADVSDTTGAIDLPIDPPMYTSASGAKQNVSALPANNAEIKVFGAVTTYSGKISPVNLIMHKDCLGFACKDLPRTEGEDRQSRIYDKDLGLSIRLTRWYNGTTDDLLFRLDVLYGWTVLRPEFGIRVQG